MQLHPELSNGYSGYSKVFMRFLRITFVVVIVITLSPLPAFPGTANAAVSSGLRKAENVESLLSPVWGPSIRQWSSHIGVLADAYGLDPDFIAAVIHEESNGYEGGISRAGAVGLMGVMPAGPGLEWRPSTEELTNPATNLRWGVAILAEVVRQSGGDISSALAAYSGGWEYANSRVPRNYAARVLDGYGRAVAARSQVSPDIAAQWTVAIQIRRGDVPKESLLILGNQPLSGLHTYGEHTVYDYIDQSGRSYYVKGYAVPVALIVPLNTDTTRYGRGDTIEVELQARLGETSLKMANSNPHVLIACLPSLSRLRGHASTRWFAPSFCPSWHR
jgi:hypothetical protein